MHIKRKLLELNLLRLTTTQLLVEFNRNVHSAVYDFKYRPDCRTSALSRWIFTVNYKYLNKSMNMSLYDFDRN